MTFDAVDAWLMLYLWLRAKGHTSEANWAVGIACFTAFVPIVRRLLA